MALRTTKKREIIATDWMIIDAIRYAMGRRSYQVAVTTEWVHLYFELLPKEVQKVIWDDLKSEIEMSIRMQKIGPDHDCLGDKHNKILWLNLFEVIDGYMRKLPGVQEPGISRKESRS